MDKDLNTAADSQSIDETTKRITLPPAAAAKGPKDEGFDAAQRLWLTTQHLPWQIALPCAPRSIEWTSDLAGWISSEDNRRAYSSVPKVLGQPGNETQATVVDTSNFDGGVPSQIEPPYRPPTFKRKLEI